MARKLQYPHKHSVSFDDSSEDALQKLSELSKKDVGVLIRELVQSGLAIIASSARQATAKKQKINTDDYSKLNRQQRRSLEKKR